MPYGANNSAVISAHLAIEFANGINTEKLTSPISDNVVTAFELLFNPEFNDFCTISTGRRINEVIPLVVILPVSLAACLSPLATKSAACVEPNVL